jgi:hypothetical protein
LVVVVVNKSAPSSSRYSSPRGVRPRHVSLYPERENKTGELTKFLFLCHAKELVLDATKHGRMREREKERRRENEALSRSLYRRSCPRDATNSNDKNNSHDSPESVRLFNAWRISVRGREEQKISQKI